MGGTGVDEGRDRVALSGNVLYGADLPVARWVASKIPGYEVTQASRALGVIRDGTIVAGVIYERHNGIHCEAAIAAKPGSVWASRDVLFRIFHYPFGTLGCHAITIAVPSSNQASLNLATKLGFEPEAIIRFAAHDGSSLVVMKMYRDTCRWMMSHGQEGIEPAASP